MILTEQEIDSIHPMVKSFPAWKIAFARAIESAVLEKLKAQSDIGFVVDNATCVTTTIRRNDDVGMLAYGTRLYAHPLPPDDVVRDAERLDWIQANCRCDPMMDGQHKWWPTNFNKCLTGPSIREAIDAAMKEMK